MLKKLLLLFSMLFFLSPSTYAYQFGGQWINVDSYIFDLSVYDANLTPASDVNQIVTSGFGLVDIDPGGDGIITAGDTFTNYFVYKATSLEDSFTNDEQPPTINVDYQISFEAVLTGHISSIASDNENFIFDNLTYAHLYIDSTTDGDGITIGDFSTAAGLGDYVDGPAVISGTGLVNGNPLVDNGGYLGIAANGQGKYQVSVGIEENAGYEGFLKEMGTNNNLSDIWEQLAMFPDGDLTRLEGSQYTTLLNSFSTHYGIDVNTTSFIYTVVEADSAIDLGVTPIPEPSTIILFGMGLLGIAGITRKKFTK
jgi:hypothetical protein